MSQKNEKVETIEEDSIFDPTRWGLADPVVGDLSERLHGFWSRFRGCLTTQTWDNSEYGFVYLRGLLTMDTNRKVRPKLQHFGTHELCSFISHNRRGNWFVEVRARSGLQA